MLDMRFQALRLPEDGRSLRLSQTATRILSVLAAASSPVDSASLAEAAGLTLHSLPVRIHAMRSKLGGLPIRIRSAHRLGYWLETTH